MATFEEGNQIKTQKWMEILESKNQKGHKLAHDLGAGSPCLQCKDNCPGLDLHFWRKVCKNCKCKKESHDVREEDDISAKFEILFGLSKCTPSQAVLDLKLRFPGDDEEGGRGVLGGAGLPSSYPKREYKLDWIPPNVSSELAAEYMQQLPAGKLPISGSDGALYRRQQLEKQVPLHDLNANLCHNLTADEIKCLSDYLENLKQNVVGQGKIMKLPNLLSSDESAPLPSAPGMPTSFSADAISSIYNTVPKPFKLGDSSMGGDLSTNQEPEFPPPPPELLEDGQSPGSFLKTPSAFIKKSRTPSPTHQLQQEGHCPASLSQGTTAPVKESEVEQDDNKNVKVGDFIKSLNSKLNNQQGTAPNKLGNINSEVTSNANLGHGSSQGNTIGNQGHAASQGLPASQGNNAFGNANSFKHPNNQSNSNSYGSPNGQTNSYGGPNNNANNGNIYGSSNIHGNVPNANSNKPANIYGNVPNTLNSNNSNTTANIYGNVPNSNIPAKPYQPTLNSMKVESFQQLDERVNAPNRMVAKNLDNRNATQATFGGGHPNGAPTSATVRVTNLDDLVDDLSRASVNGGRQNINGSVNGLTHGSGNGVTHGPCGNKLTQPRSGKTCKQCGQEVRSGDLAVYTEKLGDQVLWHPQCFVCSTCDELLVDLMYFHYKGNVYCLRDYATMLDIPRCHACDELIFVNEYTLAENKTFHVKHFCCYECDKELCNQSYIPVTESRPGQDSPGSHPYCLDCYYRNFSKKCAACREVIDVQDKCIQFNNEFYWHIKATCFACTQCRKYLNNEKFIMQFEKPFCSRQCVLDFSDTQ
ncbi:hypothetical protein M8J76_011260 [Diaphorina citri]|nr:hypothetical protein M8J76_011260 [Diaphorina citri]